MTIQTSNMDMEVKFSQALFEMYRRNEKYLIPREVYNQTLNDLKVASEEKSTKSRHSYYILGKYEIMQCGDMEKLIKRPWERRSEKHFRCFS